MNYEVMNPHAFSNAHELSKTHELNLNRDRGVTLRVAKPSPCPSPAPHGSYYSLLAYPITLGLSEAHEASTTNEFAIHLEVWNCIRPTGE
eukprot:6084855-Pyramimonas_sp.AAC.1